jgi:hypothetical protein
MTFPVKARLIAAGRGVRQNALLLALLCTAISPALAQEYIRESVTGFQPDYFAGSSPAAALEMVRLVPGFRLQEGDTTVRGYSGAVGNILIDGRPPASKQDKLEDILRRIPAGSVERIELIRPGAAGIDMQGYPLLVNVVRKVSTSLRGRVEAETIFFPNYGKPAPRLAAEITIGEDYILDLSGSANRHILEQMGGVGPRNRYAQDGSALRLADAKTLRYEDIWMVTAGWRQPLLGGRLRLNGLVKDTRTFNNNSERQIFPATTLSVGRESEMIGANEFTAQYQSGLWDGGEIEAIGIRRSTVDHLTQTLTQGASSDIIGKAAHSGETILRGVMRHHGEGFSLEGGAESALNVLNSNFAYTSNGAAIPLPGSNVRLTEFRNEFFGAATWHPLETLTLEAGARYEMSNLKQRGDSTLQRELFYLKPRAMVSWKPLPGDELRFTYERQAGQLDFANFVPEVSLNAAQISGGNKDLLPYTLWRKEAVWEHRFSAGSLVLTARDEAISNVVDRVPLSSVAGTFDGVGNIGSGKRREYQADFLVKLDMLDLPGVTAQGTYLRRFTRVTDPTTGEQRPITMDRPIEAKFSLTHDVPAWRMRWGTTWTHGNTRYVFRFNEIRRDRISELFDLFVEYNPESNLLVRLSAKNILDRPISRVRDIYRGPRNVAPFNYREERPSLIGAYVGLTLQRTFGD